MAGPRSSRTRAARHDAASWPPQLQQRWSVELGEGYASPVVADGRAFVIARRDPDELVTAIALAGGKVLWEQRYPAPFLYATKMARGPYSTPLVSNGRLFTLGATGILSAWDARTGKLVWRKDYSSRVDTSKLFCGRAMSPLAIKEGYLRDGVLVRDAAGLTQWSLQ